MDLSLPGHREALERLARAEATLLGAERMLRVHAERIGPEPTDDDLLTFQRLEVRVRRAHVHVGMARRALDDLRAVLRDEQRKVPAAFRRGRGAASEPPRIAVTGRAVEPGRPSVVPLRTASGG